jgi:hypothetical protein
MAKLRSEIDEPTLQLMKRMVHMPPKPHEEMKLGTKRRPVETNPRSASRQQPKKRRQS